VPPRLETHDVRFPPIPELDGLLGALVGPGSQPEDFDGAKLDYMIMPDEMRVFSMATIPERDEAEDHAEGIGGRCDPRRTRWWAREGGTASVDFPILRLPTLPLSTSCWAKGKSRSFAEPRFRRRNRFWPGCGACARRQRTARAVPTGGHRRFPRGFVEQAFADAQDEARMPDKAIEGVFNAPALIAEINAHVPGTETRAQPHVINLSLLPHTEGDLTFLEAALGQGDLIILSRGYGNCRIRSTGTRHCWWVLFQFAGHADPEFGGDHAVAGRRTGSGRRPDRQCRAPCRNHGNLSMSGQAQGGAEIISSPGPSAETTPRLARIPSWNARSAGISMIRQKAALLADPGRHAFCRVARSLDVPRMRRAQGRVHGGRMTQEPDPALAARVEATFAMIASTRMAGVPVMNPALGVAMRGMCRHGGHDMGVLVTPWFMNLMAFPVEAGSPGRVGEKASLALPSGAYEAIRGHEDELGSYWAVSLFSPMDQFADMDAALATADAAMAELMTARTRTGARKGRAAAQGPTGHEPSRPVSPRPCGRGCGMSRLPSGSPFTATPRGWGVAPCPDRRAFARDACRAGAAGGAALARHLRSGAGIGVDAGDRGCH
jgi:hydrogenase-1 operon protein HyaF